MNDKKLKERIIETSLQLFYVQGIHNTGINQIIKESRIAKASFYHYFPSKNDLIMECLNYYNNILMQQFLSMINSSEDFSQFASKWIKSIKNSIKNNTFNGCPIANIRFSLQDPDDIFRNRFREIIDSWISLVQNFLEELKNKKNLPEHLDTRLISERLILLYQGAVTMWKLTGKTEHLDNLLSIDLLFIP